MSSSNVINTIEDELKKLLEGRGDIGDEEKKILWGKDPPTIEFEPPKEKTGNIIYIFLYQIIENVHLKNEELQRIDTFHLQHPPLSLDLFYMVTPYGKDKNILLGRIMQIFHDHPLLILENSNGTEEEVKILFHPISLDDLTKIWSTFKDEPYQMSVSYMVTPVRIDSTVQVDVTPVMAKRMEYSYIQSKKEERA